MSTDGQGHSAAGPALGYVHQCMWALIELGRRASYEPALELRLESLDDIQFDSDGSPSELLQTKHHTGVSGPITAMSVDLWRTLNVWMDLDLNDNLILRLVTTQTLPVGSALRGLRTGEERNANGVLEELLEAAGKSGNSTTAQWRKKFLDLNTETRDDLIDRITIDDSSVHAPQIDEELTKTFRYAIPTGKEKVFVHLIKGWWAGMSVKLLARDLDALTGNDLIVQVTEIADQLKSDTLPVDPEIMREYDESITVMYQDRPFVQQLLWIALENTRLWKAIRDYHRAFSQRSFWLRHQLLAETELDRFAFRLYDEWEQIFDRRVAVMRRSGRTDADIVGQEILEELAKESRARLRERFDEPWFSRGMFHALADGELGQRIGWHPEFEAKLEGVLAHVGI
ncbi:ABC-three component system protein [Tersicoccus sp. MR15.9]|uniref:ABC-three component system protein n=1 Tax=Tersicoccus mangrovi TaxID=3121635 RepID=UPI002FE5A5C9